MATNPSALAENVGRITAPNANYTYGSAKDDTTGTAGDGTPIKKALMNDSYGFFQAAMVAAGIVPSGNAETVLESQILQALQGVVGSFSDKSQWPTVALGADTDHDIVFSAGKITDSNGLLPIVTAGLTKQIDNAWVAGTNVGGLFSGSVAVDTTYHLFLIVKDSDLSVDAGFDTDSAAANIPTGYTAFRRIASLYTDFAGNLVQFFQQGDEFTLYIPFTAGVEFMTDGVPVTKTVKSPTGLVNLKVALSVKLSEGSVTSDCRVLVSSLFAPSVTADVNRSQVRVDSVVNQADAFVSIALSAAGQVRIIGDSAPGTFQVTLVTFGWTDDRG